MFKTSKNFTKNNKEDTIYNWFKIYLNEAPDFILHLPSAKYCW